MLKVLTTEIFDDWLEGLADRAACARIIDRIDRVALGNLGDYKSLGDGLSELRLMFGAGYRIYFCRRGSLVIVLLCGGDKSTQTKDIKKAKKMMGGIE